MLKTHSCCDARQYSNKPSCHLSNINRALHDSCHVYKVTSQSLAFVKYGKTWGDAQRHVTLFAYNSRTFVVFACATQTTTVKLSGKWSPWSLTSSGTPMSLIFDFPSLWFLWNLTNEEPCKEDLDLRSREQNPETKPWNNSTRNLSTFISFPLWIDEYRTKALTTTASMKKYSRRNHHLLDLRLTEYIARYLSNLSTPPILFVYSNIGSDRVQPVKFHFPAFASPEEY